MLGFYYLIFRRRNILIFFRMDRWYFFWLEQKKMVKFDSVNMMFIMEIYFLLVRGDIYYNVFLVQVQDVFLKFLMKIKFL